MFRKKIIIEACIGSYEDAKRILEKENKIVNRFETCSNLDQGGYTPDIKTFEYIKNKNVEQVVMIRNKNTFFIEEDDLNILKQQISMFLDIGAKHFIFGYITQDKKIDINTCLELINIIKQKENTTWSFHMAIDEVENYFQEINILIDLQFTRILTKGGKKEAINNIKNLKKINKKFGKRIEIIVGGKVTKDNFQLLSKKTKIRQFHGTKIV